MIFFKGNWRDYKVVGDGMGDVRNYIVLFCCYYQLFISRILFLKLLKIFLVFKTFKNVKELIEIFFIKELEIIQLCKKLVYC